MTDFDYLGWAKLAPDVDVAMDTLVAEATWRASERDRDAGRAEVISDLREQGTIVGPDVASGEPSESPDGVPAWRDPGTDHTKMYLVGDLVSHRGRVWRSNVEGLNSWEPGADGVYGFIWADVTDELWPPKPENPEPEPGEPESPGEAEAPSEPDGSQDNPYPFAAGLQLSPGQYVVFQGRVFEVLQGHTSADHWPPPDAPSLFKAVA